MRLGLWFPGGAIGISRVPHRQLPRRGARQSLQVVKMKSRLAEVSHHGAKGLQRERRDRGFVLHAGSSSSRDVPAWSLHVTFPLCPTARPSEARAPGEDAVGHLWDREPFLSSAQAILACPFRRQAGTQPLVLLQGMGRDSAAARMKVKAMRVTFCGPPLAHLTVQERCAVLQPGIALGKEEKTARMSILEPCSTVPACPLPITWALPQFHGDPSRVPGAERLRDFPGSAKHPPCISSSPKS